MSDEWRIPHNIEESSEAAWQLWITTEAMREGWARELTYHVGDSQSATAKGFPDLIFLREHELLALELKTRHGRLSKEQKRWIGLLNSVAGVRAAALFASTDAAMNALRLFREPLRDKPGGSLFYGCAVRW